MGGFPLLDMFIGLALVYLLLALICTTLMEWIAQWRNLRGTHLRFGTQQILAEGDIAKDPPVTDAYFKHPLITALRDGKPMPSYVPSTTFAKAIRNLLTQPLPGSNPPAAVTPSPEFKRTLDSLKDPTAANPNDPPTETALAEWYDQAMEAVSGLYKKRTRKYLFFLAIFVTIVVNVNTVTLTGNLWRDPELRATLVERAKVRLEQGPPLEVVEYTNPNDPDPSPPDSAATASANRLLTEEQDMLDKYFGWRNEKAAIARLGAMTGGSTSGFLLWLVLSLIGWTVTALAVSLGAPFWFDTLNRFMQLRASGRPPASTAGVREGAAGGTKR